VMGASTTYADGGAGSPSTTTYSQVIKFKRDFNAGAYNKIAALAVDAGDPACYVYQNVQ
jgi:hypothetical protein